MDPNPCATRENPTSSQRSLFRFSWLARGASSLLPCSGEDPAPRAEVQEEAREATWLRELAATNDSRQGVRSAQTIVERKQWPGRLGKYSLHRAVWPLFRQVDKTSATCRVDV